MRDSLLRLADMLTAIDRLLDKHPTAPEDLERDEMLQVWMVHHLEVLGEAASGVEPSIRESNPDIPWRRIIATRNRLSHGYFDVDIGVVWRVVERELPVVRKSLQRVLNDLDKGDPTP